VSVLYSGHVNPLLDPIVHVLLKCVILIYFSINKKKIGYGDDAPIQGRKYQNKTLIAEIYKQNCVILVIFC
jgi:hypothetical protein